MNTKTTNPTITIDNVTIEGVKSLLEEKCYVIAKNDDRVMKLIARNTNIDYAVIDAHYSQEISVSEGDALKLVEFYKDLQKGARSIVIIKSGFRNVSKKEEVRTINGMPVYNPNHTYAAEDKLFLEKIGDGVVGVVKEITGKYDNIMNVETELGIKKFPMKRNFTYTATNVKTDTLSE